MYNSRRKIRFILFFLFSFISITQIYSQPLNVTGVVTDALCRFGNSGAIDITVTGGTPPYTFLWSNSATTEDISGLASNVTYTVTVTDAASNTAVYSGYVGRPPTQTVTGVITHVNCFGDSTGIIDITPGGGVPPYTYIWSNGATTQDISNITAGSYSVSIIDDNGCTKGANYTVTQPATSMSITNTISHASCFGINIGSIDITVSGGTPPYSYLWSNTATTQDINSLSGGTYSVVVTDDLSCISYDTFTVTQPTEITILNAITDVSCLGSSDGAINITVTDGTSPYTYSWSNSATNEDISSLSAGTYTVTVTDDNGCIKTGSGTVNQPSSALSIAISPDGSPIIICYTDGGANLKSIASGGWSSSYSYLWSNSSTADTAFLDTGIQYVCVTDANGCQACDTTKVESYPVPISASADDTICFGGSTQLSVLGGGLYFEWNPGSSLDDSTIAAPTASPTSTTTYTVSISEASGELIDNGDFSQGNTGFTSSYGYQQNLYPEGYYYVCTNPNITHDNFADMGDKTTGTGNMMVINGATVANVSVFCKQVTTLPHRTYVFSTYVSSVHPANPAVLQFSVNGVLLGSPFTASSTIDQWNRFDASWYSDTNSYATICIVNQNTIASGNDYAIDDISFAPLCSTTDQVTVTVCPTINLTSSLTHIACYGLSTGAIDITPSGGCPPYTYSWSNSATTQDLSGITAGTYDVTVYAGGNCTATGSYTITEPAEFSVSHTSIDESCAGDSDGSIDITVTGGSAPYTYAWSNSATTQDLNSISGGTYTVIVTDQNSCPAYDTIFIDATPVPALSILGLENGYCTSNSQDTLTGTPGGGTFSGTGISGNIFDPVTAGIGTHIITYSYNVTDTTTSTGLQTIFEDDFDPTPVAGWTSGYAPRGTGGTQGNSWATGQPQGGRGSSGGGYADPVTDHSPNASNNVYGQGLSSGSGDGIGGHFDRSDEYLQSPVINCSNMTNTKLIFWQWANFRSSGDRAYIFIFDGTSWIDMNVPRFPRDNSWKYKEIDISSYADGKSNVRIRWRSTSNNSSTYSGWNIDDVQVTGIGPLAIIDTPCVTTLTDTTIVTAPKTSTFTVAPSPGCIGANSTITYTGTAAPTATYTWDFDSATVVAGSGAGPYTINWPTADTFNISLTVTENGCTSSQTVNQVIVNQVTITLDSTTNVTCNGGNDGAININVSGGTTPYTYSWSNSAITEDISTLTAGSYNVTVLDALGCSTVDTYTITQPTAITISDTTSNVICYGGNNGSIDITVSGGNSPYTYSWSNSDSTEDVDSLAVGTYTVTVTDTFGCTAVDSATITQPSVALNISNITTSNVSCYGGTDGSIDITVSNGTTPYTYLWSNSSTTQDINSIPVGTYTVTVTDSNGCTDTDTAILTQPAAALTITTDSITNINCFGDSIGAIYLSVSGGTTPYTYSWSNSETTQDIDTLTAGVYIVTITDSSGLCSVVDSITISQPSAALAITVDSSNNVSCNGGSNGAIYLTVTGGTTPYSYSWSNSATSQDISSLDSGIYSVVVTDTLGCLTYDTITITEPLAPLAISNTTSSNVFCYGGFEGSIDITVVGGTTPYTYLWSNSDTTQDLDSIGAGTYIVVVTDTNGCTDTDTTTIIQPASALSITIDTTTSDVNCFGGNSGLINITVSGGNAPYIYTWSNSDTTEDVNLLVAGLYYVTVTDSSGLCSVADSITITEPAAALTIAIDSLTNVSCNAGNSGAIYLTITGGTTPYTYAWSNSDTTQDITGLDSGIYSVVVTDSLGCLAYDTIAITEPLAPLALTLDSSTNVSCNAGSDGAIYLTITGGTAPYYYSWSNSATTQDVTGLDSGIYSVVVTDTLGCLAYDTITITEPLAPLGITLDSSTNVSCNAGNNGAVYLTVTGGTAPYTYAWSNSETTQDITGLDSGIYSVVVTDALGCLAFDTITITEPLAPLAITLDSSTNVSCNGSSDGAIYLTVTGGTVPYTYSWSNSAVTQDISSLDSGIYSVVVTDILGCTISDTFIITEPDTLTISVFPNNITCFGNSDGGVDITVSGGSTPYQYLWSTAETIKDIDDLTPGTYSVIVTDSNGCTVSDSATLTQPISALSISNVISDNVSCFGGNDGSVDITVIGGTSPYSYEWSNSDSTEDISGLDTGIYYVVVSDTLDCIDSFLVTITQPVAALAITLDSTTNVRCFGDSTGAIYLTVTGGTTPYYCLWSNSDTTQNISGIDSGIYSVVVTDTLGCTAYDTITITETLTPLVLSLDTFINVSCFGGNDGEITITVSGGITPYSYNWSNAETTEDIYLLSVGSYTVTVTDSNGCTASDSATLTQPATSISISNITSVNIACYGDSSGSIDITVTGGTNPYFYDWSNGDTIQDINSLPSDTFIITTFDTLGCIARDTIILTQPIAALSVTTDSITDVSCFGGNNGAIDISDSGGTSPYTYAWSNSETTQDISGLDSGIYSVVVTDSLGCLAYDTATITEPLTAVAITLDSSTNISCYGDSSGAIYLTVAGGTSPYTYAWSNSDTTQDISSLDSGIYTIIVTDSLGCLAYDTT